MENAEQEFLNKLGQFTRQRLAENNDRGIHIGILVGEASGDILGAHLIQSLRQLLPSARFSGIGGPLMIAEGFTSIAQMDKLSVMGLLEPLKRLPSLLAIKKNVIQHFLSDRPDVFIGIDSPDFNLRIAEPLKKSGLFTVHYVSPSVWAWRQGRIKKIAKAVDLMLTLFPHEVDFYRKHHVPVAFVGHPLADEFAMQPNQDQARQALNIGSGKLLALLPGSRATELDQLAIPFFETAQWCYQQDSSLSFVIPAANAQRLQQLQNLLQSYSHLPITLIEGKSRQVMEAADAVLMASGTTTLEALLLKKPMVVAYRLSKITYMIASRLVKTPYFSLPNLLANESIVAEVLQDEVRADVLGPLLLDALNNQELRTSLAQRFTAIHQDMQCNASEKASREILMALLDTRNSIG